MCLVAICSIRKCAYFSMSEYKKPPWRRHGLSFYCLPMPIDTCSTVRDRYAKVYVNLKNKVVFFSSSNKTAMMAPNKPGNIDKTTTSFNETFKRGTLSERSLLQKTEPSSTDMSFLYIDVRSKTVRYCNLRSYFAKIASKKKVKRKPSSCESNASSQLSAEGHLNCRYLAHTHEKKTYRRSLKVEEFLRTNPVFDLGVSKTMIGLYQMDRRGNYTERFY